mmetsp:Transcript_15491/g.42618  ORF Transcript_15491/g.42618 Transcript_15491/m.42618 type:complete len:299 (+) Transcript_15491:102-998(+)
MQSARATVRGAQRSGGYRSGFSSKASLDPVVGTDRHCEQRHLELVQLPMPNTKQKGLVDGQHRALRRRIALRPPQHSFPRLSRRELGGQHFAWPAERVLLNECAGDVGVRFAAHVKPRQQNLSDGLRLGRRRVTQDPLAVQVQLILAQVLHTLLKTPNDNEDLLVLCGQVHNGLLEPRLGAGLADRVHGDPDALRRGQLHLVVLPVQAQRQATAEHTPLGRRVVAFSGLFGSHGRHRFGGKCVRIATDSDEAALGEVVAILRASCVDAGDHRQLFVIGKSCVELARRDRRVRVHRLSS